MFTTISTIGVYTVVGARVRVVTGPFMHYFSRRVEDIRARKDELFTELEPKGLEILEEEAPKKTGNFSRNFQSDRDENRLWWFNTTVTKDGILLDLILDNSAGVTIINTKRSIAKPIKPSGPVTMFHIGLAAIVESAKTFSPPIWVNFHAILIIIIASGNS